MGESPQLAGAGYGRPEGLGSSQFTDIASLGEAATFVKISTSLSPPLRAG